MHSSIHGVGKAKNSKKVFREFVRSLKKYLFLIIISIILSVGSATLGIFIPKILGDMTNIAVETYEQGIDFAAIHGRVVLVIVLFVSSALLNYGQAYILAVVTAKYTRDLREKIIDKISRLPISYFDTHKYGDVLSRMTNDIDVLTTSLSQEIADVTLSLTTLVGVIIIMITISAPLTLISFVVVALSVFVVTKITKYAQKFFQERQRILGTLSARVEEDYAGQNIININSYEPTAKEKFDEINGELTKTTTKAQIFASLSMPVTHVFTNVGYVNLPLKSLYIC